MIVAAVGADIGGLCLQMCSSASGFVSLCCNKQEEAGIEETGDRRQK